MRVRRTHYPFIYLRFNINRQNRQEDSIQHYVLCSSVSCASGTHTTPLLTSISTSTGRTDRRTVYSTMSCVPVFHSRQAHTLPLYLPPFQHQQAEQTGGQYIALCLAFQCFMRVHPCWADGCYLCASCRGHYFSNWCNKGGKGCMLSLLRLFYFKSPFFLFCFLMQLNFRKHQVVL